MASVMASKKMLRFGLARSGEEPVTFVELAPSKTLREAVSIP